ncbi:hypothetical protein acdb102_35780 [Acidothermaceae bacterium B102]|nr:hypothetical protein acdb102_35780 [Acidothermaceae bacterium B102]
MTDTPDVVTRYLKAGDEKDIAALVACFTADGTVTDEGHTYTGADEIAAWRAKTISQWTYTTVVTGSHPLDGGGYRVDVHIEGDFPGGVVDLGFVFVLADDLIAALTIA